MTEPSTHATDHPEPTASDDSFTRMLLVFALVGGPIAGVGMSIGDAAPTTFGLSVMGVGLLAGSLVFCALWVGGFRPSLTAAVVFFLLESLVTVTLIVGVSGIVPIGSESWLRGVLRAVGVALTAWVVFGGVGTRVTHLAYRRLRRQLKLPDDEPRERR